MKSWSTNSRILNDLQNAIINLISRGANVFRVGDVKQSIYRFRGGKPQDHAQFDERRPAGKLFYSPFQQLPFQADDRRFQQ